MPTIFLEHKGKSNISGEPLKSATLAGSKSPKVAGLLRLL